MTVAWGAFGLYLAVTSWLAWVGHRKTDSLESFALGRRDMGPWLVGITMAASLCSTATFVINPGFVHAHGLSAFLHFGVAVGLGVAAAMVIMSRRFREIGVEGTTLSLPHWIGHRFRSKGLRVGFALLSLLSITFVVLIVGGVRILLQQTLGLSELGALSLTILFVFGYILVGGTYAHTYTNSVQGVMMLIVTLAIGAKTLGILVEPGFWSGLQASSPELLSAVNPQSDLFGSVFQVGVAGFVVGFAVVCQPHLLTKPLYLERDQDVRRYIQVTLGVTAFFFTLLLAGLAAHATLAPGAVAQDKVMAVWLAGQFGPFGFALISVALVAAGMSTLDGILVATSTIAGNDLFQPLAQRWLEGRSPDEQQRLSLRFGQATLILMGLAAFLICLDPPRLLGIFGQVGVYGVLAASVGPVILGLRREPPAALRPIAILAATVGAGAHFALYLSGYDPNPAVTATWGILGAGLVSLVGVSLLPSDGDLVAREPERA